VCQHKNQFPFLKKEYGSLVICFVLLLISNISGNAGGGVVVLIAQIFYGFDVKSSVGISVAVNFAGSITRYLYTWNQRNPNKPDVVLQDYSIATILLPSILLGN
jgi:uncharacterized membrane protein YfcA